jgi:carbamoyltransferase
MITWGINALNHDASIAVMAGKELKFWKRSSEFSGIRGDDKLNSQLVRAALDASSGKGPTNIVWYERPWLKKTRQLYAGQYNWAFDLNELPSRYLKEFRLGYAKIHYMPHHLSHAAAGFLTSPFEDAVVVVLDAMGEWESATIWQGQGTKLKKLWSRSYPTSLGLFYSAFTDLVGLKPLGEEHVLQQMSDRGDPNRFGDEVYRYWKSNWKLKYNLHKGVCNWKHPIETEQDRCDIAAAVQAIFEIQAEEVMNIASELSDSTNLVYMGGCAMNNKFNELIVDDWNGVWSLPIPGDAASSIGAALYFNQARHNYKGDLAKHIEIKYNKL